MKDRVSNGRMCCKEPLMLRSGRLQSRQVAGRARGAGLPAPGLAEGRAHCGANRVGACCGEGQGAEQAHLAGEEGRSSRSPKKTRKHITHYSQRHSLRGVSQRAACMRPEGTLCPSAPYSPDNLHTILLALTRHTVVCLQSPCVRSTVTEHDERSGRDGTPVRHVAGCGGQSSPLVPQL